MFRSRLYLVTIIVQFFFFQLVGASDLEIFSSIVNSLVTKKKRSYILSAKNSSCYRGLKIMENIQKFVQSKIKRKLKIEKLHFSLFFRLMRAARDILKFLNNQEINNFSNEIFHSFLIIFKYLKTNIKIHKIITFDFTKSIIRPNILHKFEGL